MLIRLLRDIWRSRRSRGLATSNPVAPGPSYSPTIFQARDLEAAKAIILTPTPDMTTDERWEVETQNLVEELGRVMSLEAESRILDYGCGIGRVAKALIDRYGCSVVGVDISAEMRKFAAEYVKSDRFVACDPPTLDRMIREGFRATGAYACWVLQHCHVPEQDIHRIESALSPGALFYVLNSESRWVPTDRGWATDGVSVEELLKARFEALSKSGVSQLVGSPLLAGQSYAMLLKVRR